MSIVFTNNSSTTLASAILYTDVSFTVATGTGSTFPAISGGDVAYITLTNGSTLEIVKVTGRSGDIFTCVRGQDGTTAVPWAAGTTVQLRTTAAALTGMAQKANNLSDLANAGNARTNLGVAIGSNVQAWDGDLDAIAALTGTTGVLRKTAANTWTLDTTILSGSGWTNNGVLYANGSGQAVNGSALTFDGATLTNGGNIAALGGDFSGSGASGYVQLRAGSTDTNTMIIRGASAGARFEFDINGSEQMRLTSTGLGIGTSSPSYKLDVSGTFRNTGIARLGTGSTTTIANIGDDSTVNTKIIQFSRASAVTDIVNIQGINAGVGASDIAINASGGNVGIGTSSPDVKLTVSGGGTAVSASGGTVARFINSGVSRIDIVGGNTNYSILEFSRANLTAAGQVTYNHSTNAMSFATNGAVTQATIDSSGNLGLGVTPSAWNAGNVALQIANGAAFGGLSGGYTVIGQNYYGAAGTDKYIAAIPASRLYLYQNSFTWQQAGTGAVGGSISWTSAMTLDGNGNWMVGVTTATNNPVNGISTFNTSSATQLGIGHATGTANGTGYLVFNYNAGAIGSITQSGTTAVLYNVTSDQRLKENIVDAESSSTLIDLIQVRQYDWKSDGSHQRYGFIAQELVTVAPEAVHQPADPEEMMAVDYSKLVPMLVKEIQSLRKRLATLESK